MYHSGAFLAPRQASYPRRTCACSTENSKHWHPVPRRLLQHLDKANAQACGCFRALQDNEIDCALCHLVGCHRNADVRLDKSLHSATFMMDLASPIHEVHMVVQLAKS
jgi:hypothetical protein